MVGYAVALVDAMIFGSMKKMGGKPSALRRSGDLRPILLSMEGVAGLSLFSFPAS